MDSSESGQGRWKNTDHPHEVLLTVFPVADVAAVAVPIARVCPAPEPATLLLFFANGTFAGYVHDGVVIANRACDVDVGGRGRELGVEGVEDAHRRIGASTLLFAFSGGVLWEGRTELGRPREGRCGSRRIDGLGAGNGWRSPWRERCERRGAGRGQGHELGRFWGAVGVSGEDVPAVIVR